MEGFEVIMYDAFGEEVRREWCKDRAAASYEVQYLLDRYKDHFNSHSQAQVKIIATWRD